MPASLSRQRFRTTSSSDSSGATRPARRSTAAPVSVSRWPAGSRGRMVATSRSSALRPTAPRSQRSCPARAKAGFIEPTVHGSERARLPRPRHRDSNSWFVDVREQPFAVRSVARAGPLGGSEIACEAVARAAQTDIVQRKPEDLAVDGEPVQELVATRRAAERRRLRVLPPRERTGPHVWRARARARSV
jgi:hypothetical protein